MSADSISKIILAAIAVYEQSTEEHKSRAALNNFNKSAIQATKLEE